jgi:hypothetical protein
VLEGRALIYLRKVFPNFYISVLIGRSSFLEAGEARGGHF